MIGLDLKIKVCGMKHQQNVDELIELGVDYLGNIFFDKSPRSISQTGVKLTVNPAKKVGVFVKESIDVIKEKVKMHQFDVVQLHGADSNEICKQVKEIGIEVWRVCPITENFDFSELKKFPDADFFLFDTKTEKHGGSGKKFDWSLLELLDKESTKKYFLAGGIGPEDAQEIKNLHLENLYGLDLNSKFEIEPGLKNVQLLKEFLKELRT